MLALTGIGRWLGWYNAPGSGTVAKEFGRMANSRFCDALFPGPNDPPAVLFGLDGKKGPQYIAALSGMTFPMGHLGYLTIERSKEVEGKAVGERYTVPIGVAYLAMTHVDSGSPVKLLPLKSALWGLIPITVSVVTCIMCALVYDWFCFSVILAGMITSGLTSTVIGEGGLVIKSSRWQSAGAGHGILIGEDEVVVIKGAERDVNVLTRGRFDLVMAMKQGVEAGHNIPKYHAIGICSLLLLVPVLLQLLLIPQGTFFGQLMFLVSLGVSWVYNFYLSSLGREKIHTDILFEALGCPQMLRFRTGTRTTMAVFVCLLLFHRVERSSPEKDHDLRIKILNSCVLNDTAIWRRWKEKVVEQHLNIDYGANCYPTWGKTRKTRSSHGWTESS